MRLMRPPGDDLLSGCPVCSHLISKNTKSCPNCGEPDPFQQLPNPEDFKKLPMRVKLVVWGVVILLIILFGLGLGMGFYEVYRWIVSTLELDGVFPGE